MFITLETALDEVGFSFYEKENNSVYIETKISSKESFVVLKHQETCQVAVPVIEETIPIIRYKDDRKRFQYSIPVILDEEAQEFIVMSPEQYYYNRAEQIPLNLIPIVNEKRNQLMSYLRTMSFDKDNRYVLIEDDLQVR